MAHTGLETSIRDLIIQNHDLLGSQIEELYSKPSSLNVEDATKILNTASSTKSSILRKKVNEDVETTVFLLKKIQNAKFLCGLLQDDTTNKYVKILKLNVKSSTEDQTINFKAIDSFITSLKPNLSEIEPLLSVIIPFIDSSDSVFLTLVKCTTIYEKQSYPFFEEQLEILTLDQNLLASFRLLSLLFKTSPQLASKLFKMESLQNLLLKLNAKSTAKSIKAALNLLSDACIDKNLRIFILENFLSVLVISLKNANYELKTLASLVVLKTWNLNALASENIQVDDLVDIFVASLNEHSIEGLTYITLRKAVKIRLREDEGFIFDLFDLLNKSTNSTIVYGIITIFANLSVIEEKNEFSELKKQAQKNLEEEIEEDIDQIERFKEDLIERKLVATLSKHISKSTNVAEQILKVLYNLTRSKKTHSELIKQGALHLLLKFVGIVQLESRPQGLRALSSLLATSDPKLIFGKDSPKTAFNFLFHSLIEETSSSTDQNLAIIALTNLSVMSIEALSSKQWEIIDQFLLNENKILRRSTIEFVSNLMLHRENMVELFNFQKSSAKKRFELIVEYTQLEDIKSQSAALSAIAFGVSIPFIAEEVAKSDHVLEYLIRILQEQLSETDLVERALFIVYHILFFLNQSEPNGSIMQKLRSNEVLKSSILKIMKINKDRETVQMATELALIIKSNK